MFKILMILNAIERHAHYSRNRKYRFELPIEYQVAALVVLLMIIFGKVS